MSESSKSLGARGEEIAAHHLTNLGWKVVQRNWRCPEGEIDLIAIDPDGVVVFIEVKCRSGLGFGDPLEAITRAKVMKLRQLASIWMSKQGPVGLVRVDAIGILLQKGDFPKITHIKGILG